MAESIASPPLSLTLAESLFPIHAGSLDQRHYKNWVKRTDGARFIMNPWTKEELYLALSLHPDIDPLTMEDVQEALKAFGPCIRDIVRAKLTVFTNARVNFAISSIDVSQLRRLTSAARNLKEDQDVHLVSHALFYIQRISSDISGFLEDDDAFVEVKSHQIAVELLDKIQELAIQDA